MNQSSNPQTGNNTQSGTKNNGSSPTDSASSALKDGIAAGARDITKEVKHVAGDVAIEAKKAAESKLDEGKDFAAEQLGAVAGALRETSRQLRQGESGLTDYVEKAARSVDGVSTYLQTRTLSQLISDVEGYARREPAVFLGGSFFVGLLGGRFLKSATPTPARTNGNAMGKPNANGNPIGNGDRSDRGAEIGVSQKSQGADSQSTRAPREGDTGKAVTSTDSKADGGDQTMQRAAGKDGSKTGGTPTRGSSTATTTPSSSPKGEGRGGVG